MGVSLKPSDAVAGGGKLDNSDVTITKMRFRTWDYNGTIAAPVLGLQVEFDLHDGGQVPQVYSAGDLKNFVPAEDGLSAVPIGHLSGLVESTNAMAFIASLVNVGFPEDKVGDDISVFEGMQVHLDEQPQPKRGGKASGGDNKQIALATKLLAMPGEKTKGAAKGQAGQAKTQGTVAGPKKSAAPVASQAPPTNGAVDDALMTETTGHVLAVLTGKGGAVEKKVLANELFKLVQKEKNRNAIMQLAFKDQYLSGGMGDVPFSFDGTTIALGE